MAFPTVRAVGAKLAQGVGNSTITAPTGLATGDLEILIGSCDITDTLSILNNGGGAWTAIGTHPIDVASGGERAYVWYRTHAGGDSDPSLQNSVDHFTACRIAITAGTFGGIEAVAQGSETTNDTSFSFAPGTSTSVADCLVFCLTTTKRDSNVASTGMPMANGSLANLTLQADYCTNTNFGGGFGISSGEKATAGSIGTFTSTYAQASEKAYIAFAVKPPSAGRMKVKSGGSFALKPVKVKAGGSFATKPAKVKVGGSFV